MRRALGLALALTALATPALAYIGPGAGLALGGAFLTLLGTFALAFGIILTWPFKVAYRMLRPVRRGPAQARRVVIVGLDGFDPELARRFAREGRLPNLMRLEQEGCFHALETSCPSISPVAWSTFATGTDASQHTIYDFLTRDPCSYAPVLSSTEIESRPRTLNLGFARIACGTRAGYRLLQRGQPFWKLLGESRVWSSILRVPITFPPQPFKNGTLLSGMCVPDLQGTQGSFSFYSTRERPKGTRIGGQQFQVVIRSGRIESNLLGPRGKDGHPLRAPFTLVVPAAGAAERFKLTLGGQTVEVGAREYTPWLQAEFAGGLHGIVRFYVQGWDGRELDLYATPVQIDPARPALPISHPFVYSIYLAKSLGPFATLGLAEDTWALNERVIDEQAFLEQSWLIFEERKRQLWDALEKTRAGLVTCVFDTSDRISHMFWRTLEPGHPANAGKEVERWKDVIPETYARMDALVGEVRERIGVEPGTVLMVISDHGFTSFRRGVNLNTWLRANGYLFLKEGHETSGDWFAEVDWSRTKAFTLGLTGLFVNRKGREQHGLVEPGAELDALCRELKAKLEALRDPLTGEPAIREVFLTPADHGDAAPELLIGYHKGYRHSWDCATGAVTREVFSDNTRSWSGDHCVDPRLVPGVFWCNRAIDVERPALIDIAPTVLDLFGVDVPSVMQGRPLFGGRMRAPSAPAAPSRSLDPEQALR